MSLNKGIVSKIPDDVLKNINSLFHKKKQKIKKNSMDMSCYNSNPPKSDSPSSRFEGSSSLKNTYSSMTPGQSSSIKEENEEKNKEDYRRWKKLVNMSSAEIQSFLDSQDGKVAGLSRKEAANAGTGGGKITSGRDSARAIIRMKNKPFSEWDESDMKWMRKQISFISRMSGNPGKLKDENGRPTRKLLSLKVWGHNPGKS